MDSASDIIEILPCSVGEETYGLELPSVVDLKERPPAGDTNGDSLPTFSLAERLGYAPRNGKSKWVITLRTGERQWNLQVDSVSDVLSLPTERIGPLPSLAQNQSESIFKGVVHLPSEVDALFERDHPPKDRFGWRSEAVTIEPEPTTTNLMLLLAPERLDPTAPANDVDDHPRLDALPAPRSLPKPMGKKYSQQILLFTVPVVSSIEQDWTFALSVSQVLEIVEPLPLLPVPHAREFVRGIMNWRTHAVTLFDLAAWFGFEPDTSDRNFRLMIVRTARSAELAAFAVRTEVHALRLPVVHQPSQREWPFDPQSIRALFEMESRTIAIPDLNYILAAG